jgi:LysM repeat protein
VTPALTPAPTSDRYALLQPCPDKPDCYIYTIRHGDNLTGIAKYFGVPLQTVRDLNPWTQTKGIQPGNKLILPPPTR